MSSFTSSEGTQHKRVAQRVLIRVNFFLSLTFIELAIGFAEILSFNKAFDLTRLTNISI